MELPKTSTMGIEAIAANSQMMFFCFVVAEGEGNDLSMQDHILSISSKSSISTNALSHSWILRITCYNVKGYSPSQSQQKD